MQLVNYICSDALTNCQLSLIVCLIVLAFGIGFAYLDYIIPIIVGVAVFGFVTWVGYCIYWVSTRVFYVRGLLLKWKLKRKFKNNFVLDDKIVDFCQYALKNRWKFRELNQVTKHNLQKDEILYTYLLLKELMKNDKLKIDKTKKLQDFSGMIK
jgi:hypothetical protein